MEKSWIPITGSAGRVEHAFQMARGLPTHERVRLRVGVLSGEGLLIASETLRGFEQVAFLRDQLSILGYQEYLPSGGAQPWGCDVLLKRASGDADLGDDLLRSDSLSWPPGRTRTAPPHF